MSVRQSKRTVLARGFMQAIVTAWNEAPADALILTPSLHLMGAAGFTPTPDTLTADLTAVEASYSGYLTLGGDVSGTIRLGTTDEGCSYDALFVGDNVDPFVPDTITGWWLTSGSDWVAGGTFGTDGPVQIAAPGDWLFLLGLIAVFGAAAIPG
jgi:hypothetical protein